MFFVLHFLLPFVVVCLVLVHLLSLHKSGSTSGLRLRGRGSKVPFYPFFVWKDCLGLAVWVGFFCGALVFPVLFRDPEMWLLADAASSPVHIQPE